MFMNYLEFYLAVCGQDQKHYLRNRKSKIIETALQNDAQDQIWLLLKRSIVHSIFDVSSKEELCRTHVTESICDIFEELQYSLYRLNFIDYLILILLEQRFFSIFELEPYDFESVYLLRLTTLRIFYHS
ncbi:Hypothetical_protein [Hexamita inflata]|uniref:Hypothetical_protein n=1 Tax=Hexamita inflata TaxID=28002 RepID=A0AA86RAW2_9EUKA|nr:Hypothetical protein HINF_LOCUS62256 [Hexamita inflata]